MSFPRARSRRVLKHSFSGLGVPALLLSSPASPLSGFSRGWSPQHTVSNSCGSAFSRCWSLQPLQLYALSDSSSSEVEVYEIFQEAASSLAGTALDGHRPCALSSTAVWNSQLILKADESGDGEAS